MDDVKAVIEQATDAAIGTPPEAPAEAPDLEMGTPPEAPAEAPELEMKKVRRAAAKKVRPKNKVGKKAKKSAKKPPKKAPKKAKAKKPPTKEVFCFRLLEGEPASRHRPHRDQRPDLRRRHDEPDGDGGARRHDRLHGRQRGKPHSRGRPAAASP